MTTIIDQTIAFVKKTLADAEAGHDWFHIERVLKNARTIAGEMDVDQEVVALAALLHDIADSKFHQGDEEVGPTIAREFLEKQKVPTDKVNHVCLIIKNMSYSAGLSPVSFHSEEMAVVQDADRLDAIGAIGIARAFHYGGFKNRQLYNPDIPPDLSMDKEAYRKSTAPTINHFYEKLLLLKDKMNTPAGRALALQRHEYMRSFLDEFYAEWSGSR